MPSPGSGGAASGVGRAASGAGGARTLIKRALAVGAGRAPAEGATLLIYHRVGGGTTDELDQPVGQFARQLELLSGHDVLSLDAALDRLDAGDRRPCFVLTFDDGFADLYEHAWPLLRRLGLPFTVYLASAYVDQPMRWEGTTAKGTTGRGLTWAQLGELVASGLCTVGNHTHHHVRPSALTTAELDSCSDAIAAGLGVRPAHFAFPWGVAVPELAGEIRARFRSAATGELGRNLPGGDPWTLRRVPVRRTDPESFFAAKLTGALGPERAYGGMVRLAKRMLSRGGA